MNRTTSVFKMIRYAKRNYSNSSKDKPKEFWDSPEPMFIGAFVTLWSVIESVNTTRKRSATQYATN